MGAYTDAILKQGEAHAFTRDRAFEHLEALRAIREEDAALRQQVKEEATGIKLVGPDGRPVSSGGTSPSTPLPKPPYPQTPPPAPPTYQPPANPYKPITTGEGGGGSAGGGGGASSSGGGSSFAKSDVLQSREGNFASLEWIKKNGRRIKVKIYNPANAMAMFTNPPDMVDVDAWATSLGTFIDPDSLAALGTAYKPISSSSTAGSGGGGQGYQAPYWSFGRHSDGTGSQYIDPNRTPEGGKSLSGPPSASGGAGGGGSAGGGGAVKVTVQVPGQTGPARPTGPTPGEVMIHQALGAIEGVLRDIKNAPPRAGAGIGLNREKL